jgi:hypothetical protein
VDEGAGEVQAANRRIDRTHKGLHLEKGQGVLKSIGYLGSQEMSKPNGNRSKVRRNMHT